MVGAGLVVEDSGVGPWGEVTGVADSRGVSGLWSGGELQTWKSQKGA